MPNPDKRLANCLTLECCIFRPAFGCCALWILVEISFSYIFTCFWKILMQKWHKLCQKEHHFDYSQPLLTQKMLVQHLENNFPDAYKKVIQTTLDQYYLKHGKIDKKCYTHYRKMTQKERAGSHGSGRYLLCCFEKSKCCVFWSANGCSACFTLVKIIFLMLKQLFLSFSRTNIKNAKFNKKNMFKKGVYLCLGVTPKLLSISL